MDMNEVNPHLLLFLRDSQANMKSVELFVEGVDAPAFGGVEICGEEAAFLGLQNGSDKTSGCEVWVNLHKVWGWRVRPYGSVKGDQCIRT